MLGRLPSSSGPSARFFDNEITRGVRDLLSELAEPLLMAGITPKCFGDLATNAFVEAACKASKFRNGKINKSRVAVLTGLNRPEVRRLMQSMRATPGGVHPPTIRVLRGWTADRRYTSAKGEPLALRIDSTRASFTSLVRKYAGDVPYRAVLEELRRANLVREIDGHVELIRTAFPSMAIRKALYSILPVVTDSVRIAVARTNSNAVPAIYRLKVRASDSRDLITVKERATAAAVSLLDGLDRSLQPPSRLARRSKHSVTITILVREQERKSIVGRRVSDERGKKPRRR